MRTDSFQCDAAGPGVGLDADVETKSPPAQMKPGFLVAALLTHFHCSPEDARSWHSADAPLVDPA